MDYCSSCRPNQTMRSGKRVVIKDRTSRRAHDVPQASERRITPKPSCNDDIVNPTEYVVAAVARKAQLTGEVSPPIDVGLNAR